MPRKSLKYLHIGPYGLCALCLIALAIALRTVLISQGWPTFNSDEGTMGLMALHIAYHGETPLFFYGQGFVGSLEAYLAAPLFHLFGPSIFTLRLGLVFLYALFLGNMYLLTRGLYTKGLALFTLLLLAFGAPEMLLLHLAATGGHPDALFFGSLLLLSAFTLARTSGETSLTRERYIRVLAYAGWGVIAGLALWDDLLLLPFVMMSGWLLVRFCFRELHWPVVLCIMLGFLLPMIPIIVYNFRVPLDQSTLAVVGNVFQLQGKTIVGAPLLMRIAGTLFVALPRATGGNVLCTLSYSTAWPPFVPQHASAIPCTVVNGIWGGGFLLLLIITAGAAYRALKRTSRDQPWTQEQRQEAVASFAQLMLVGSAILTLIAYTSSSASGLDPWNTTRYLTTLPLALPAVLWPLWRAGVSARGAFLATSARILSSGLLLMIVLSFTLGYVQTLDQIPGPQRAQQQDAALIQDLLKMNITDIYTDYWTCDRIAFESTERIVCSVVNEQLQPSFNRYPAYAAIVKADPHAAWVFPLGSAHANTFVQNMRKATGIYRSFLLDGYVIGLRVVRI